MPPDRKQPLVVFIISVSAAGSVAEWLSAAGDSDARCTD